MGSDLAYSDLVVLVGFLATSVLIGVYQSKVGKGNNGADFINGQRRLALLPTVLSMMVSFHSAILILGNVAEIYRHGSQAWLWQNLSSVVGLLISERIFIPWIYKMKLTSVYEFIERRYKSQWLRKLGSFCGILGALMYMSVAMIAPSIALQVAVNIPFHISVPLMGAVCTLYTTLGGMKAVIWTDVFQFTVILGGMLMIMFKGIVFAGGFGNVWNLNDEGGRIFWIKTDLDPTVRHTVWGFVFGWLPVFVQIYSLNQAGVQRYSSLPSLGKARLSVLLNVPLIIVVPGMVYVTGMSVYAYYSVIGCDPLASGAVRTGNEILPYYVSTVFREWWGFQGLFLAMLYSGALSSVSSSLSANAALTWEDFLKVVLPDRLCKSCNQVLILCYGALAVALSFIITAVPGNILQVSITLFSMINGPLAGIFLLGGLTRRSNASGVIVGVVCAMVVMTTVTLGSVSLKNHQSYLPLGEVDRCTYNVTAPPVNVPQPLIGIERFYGMSYLWYFPLGLGITMVIGFLSSLLLGGCKQDPDIEDDMMITTDYLFSFDYSEGNRIADINLDEAESKM